MYIKKCAFFSPSSITKVKSSLLFCGFEPLSWTLFFLDLTIYSIQGPYAPIPQFCTQFFAVRRKPNCSQRRILLGPFSWRELKPLYPPAAMGTQPQRPGQRCSPGCAAAGLVTSAGSTDQSSGLGPKRPRLLPPHSWQGRAPPCRSAPCTTQSLEGEQSTWCKMMAFFSMRKLKYFGLSNLPAASESAERQDCAGVSRAPAP